MLCSIQSVVLICLILHCLQKIDTKTLEKRAINRDDWVWGKVEPVWQGRDGSNGTISKPFITTSPEPPPSTTPVEDYCAPYNPPVPDFGPGRRISEVKCLEYIWNLKLRSEKFARKELCRLQNNNIDGYPAQVDEAVGGRITLPGEFPHMGAIGWKTVLGSWDFKCGASLISSKFMLTAAHCSTASSADTSLADPVPKIVRLSYKNIIFNIGPELGKHDENIANIIVHPEYHSPKKYYDIALIQLEHDLGFTQFVQPSCLWSKPDTSELGTSATLTGWGVLKPGSVDISPELQAAVVDIVNNSFCDQLLTPACNRNWCGVKENQLCAGKLAGGVDACQGDSGGPLQVRIELGEGVQTSFNIYQIIGVTSFGIGCAEPNLPGMYTRVSSFIDWIENIVWP